MKIEDLPDLQVIKDKIKSYDVLQDINDYSSGANRLPQVSASDMTQEDIISIFNFHIEEIKRLNIKVWNLLRLEQERLEAGK